MSGKSATKKMNTSSIQVIVRLRPMNEKEKNHGTLPVITASTQDKTVTVIKGQGSRQARTSFSFDHVFTAFSTQEEVFEETLKSVVGDVLQGFESTVFAYGQTGTGKTYTMEGDLSSPEMQGVIPRSARAIFEALKQPQYSEFSVSCSYLEIYNEELCDLFLDDGQRLSEKKGNPKLEIMDGKKGTVCRGLSQKEVKSPEDVLILMQNAQNQRKIGETKMNKNSSRSHCIFTLTVNAKSILVDDGGTLDFTGKLHMVDLAGSECAKTAGLDKKNSSEASRDRERMNINRSLLTLGRVISLLKEQSTNKKNNLRIPYRDSKLTRILQESLGGRCKTVVIATLSPSITAIEESISTLNYAQSARGIMNKPVTTSYFSVTPKSSSFKVNGGPSEESSGEMSYSIDYWQDMECRLQYMQDQVEEAQAALARKHMQQQEYLERAEKAEVGKSVVDEQLLEANRKLNSLEEDMHLLSAKQKQTEEELEICQTSLKNTKAILKETQNTEHALTCEAKVLIQTLKEVVADGDRLYDLLKTMYEKEVARTEASKLMESNTSKQLDKNFSIASSLSQHVSLQLTNVSGVYEENILQEKKSLEKYHAIFQNIVEHIKTLASSHGDGADEILGKIKTSETEMMEAMSSIAKIIDEGDQVILHVCERTRDDLQKNWKNMEELGNSHAEKVKNSLSVLEENIVTSENYVSNMIQHAIEALNEGQEKLKLARSKHNDLFVNWRKTSIENLTDSKAAIRNEDSALCESKDKFSNQLKYYDNIKKNIYDQQNLLQTKGIVQKDDIRNQSLNIDEQEKLIVNAKNNLLETQESVMKNLVAMFQDMLQSEMRKVSEETEKTHKKLLSGNDRIKKDNESIEIGASEIFSKVDETNANIVEHVDAVLSNDHDILKAIDNTSAKLKEMEKQTDQHLNSVRCFGEEADKDMKTFTDLDRSTAEEFSVIKKNGERCAEHMRLKLQDGVVHDISDLSDYGERMLIHSKDAFIGETSTSLDKILDSRKPLFQEIQNRFSNVNTMHSQSNKAVVDIVDEQRRIVNKSMVFAHDSETLFKGELMSQREDQIDATMNKIMERIEQLRCKTQRDLGDCTEQTKDVKDAIGAFCHGVMQTEEKQPALHEKRVFLFSEDLTSTPTEEKILNISQSGLFESS